MPQLRAAPAPSVEIGVSDPEAALILSLVGDRPRAPAGIDWEEAVGLLRAHGLEGLAAAAHRRAGLLPDRVAAELEPAYRLTGLRSTLTLEAARRARSALADAGIPSLLYKGAALLEDGTYPDPGGRRMDDADLVIPPERADEAVGRLQRAGFEPWSPWIGERVRWLDSVCLTDREAPPGTDEITVDLHWRVRYGRMRYGEATGPDVLWEDADLEGGLPAPGPHFLVLAEHLLKHLHVLVHFPGLADLARLSRRLEEWEWVADRAARHPSARAFGVLFGFLGRELGAPVPAEAGELGGGSWTRRLSRRALDPAALVRSGSPAGGRIRGLLFRWLLAGSPVSALGEVLRTTLPGSRWLRARYGTADGWLPGLYVRYWRDVLRWATGRGRSPVSPNQEFFE